MGDMKDGHASSLFLLFHCIDDRHPIAEDLGPVRAVILLELEQAFTRIVDALHLPDHDVTDIVFLNEPKVGRWQGLQQDGGHQHRYLPWHQ